MKTHLFQTAFKLRVKMTILSEKVEEGDELFIQLGTQTCCLLHLSVDNSQKRFGQILFLVSLLRQKKLFRLGGCLAHDVAGPF